MVMALNEATVMGHLGDAPAVRTTQSGDRVVNFTLATAERWTGKDGVKQERTEWHRIEIWNKGAATLAERYLKKGSPVWVRGQLRTQKWTDQAGVERYTTKIVLGQFSGELKLIDSAGGGSAGSAAGGAGSGGAGASGGAAFDRDLDDDVPF